MEQKLDFSNTLSFLRLVCPQQSDILVLEPAYHFVIIYKAFLQLRPIVNKVRMHSRWTQAPRKSTKMINLFKPY